MHCITCRFHFKVFFLIIPSFIAVVSGEYCDTETFKVTCAPDELMQVLSAEYGHMDVGKCIESDTGNLGCKTDVKGILKRRCEGQSSCVIEVLDQELRNTKPCKRGIYVYLWATYACLKGKVVPDPSLISTIDILT